MLERTCYNIWTYVRWFWGGCKKGRLCSGWGAILVYLGSYSNVSWTGWLVNNKLISHSSRVWKSEIRVLAWSGCGEDPFLSSEWIFSQCPHMAERVGKFWVPLLFPFIRAHFPVLISFQRPHLLLLSYWRSVFQHKFVAIQTFSSFQVIPLILGLFFPSLSWVYQTKQWRKFFHIHRHLLIRYFLARNTQSYNVFHSQCKVPTLCPFELSTHFMGSSHLVDMRVI